MTVIVLGIDPGTANTGYGVVLAHGQRLAALDGGVIATDAHEPLERRLPRPPPPQGAARAPARAHPRARVRSDPRARSARRRDRGPLLREQRPQRLQRRPGAWGRDALRRTLRRPGLLVHPAGREAGGVRLGAGREGPGAADGPGSAVA